MPANAVFLDTNGWFALLNTREGLHRTADLEWRKLGREGHPIVLTDWVIAETGNGLARTRARGLFSDIVRQLLRTPTVRVVFITPILLERALELYSQRPDKAWGLVDCASFIVMSDEGITEAFTTDHHFEQAGFTCLLPASVA